LRVIRSSAWADIACCAPSRQTFLLLQNY
jgi:hypothetical protein